MTSNASDPRPPQPSGLQSMLARLRGMVQALKSPEPEQQPGQELLPTWDPGLTPVAPFVPSLVYETSEPAAETSSADPSETSQTLGTEGSADLSTPVLDGSSETTTPSEPVTLETSEAAPSEGPAVTGQLCPFCQAPRPGNETYCADCGWIFPPPRQAPHPPPSPSPPALLIPLDHI